MISTFNRSGIQFQYPSNWNLDLEEDGVSWTATVQSNELAFVLVSFRPDAADPAELADEALVAIREEYKELDAENAIESFNGLPAVGHNIDFLTVDMSITCRTRAFDTPGGPTLVLCQFGEYDREKNEPVLDAICASMRFTSE
ncbi:hypothetical protein [Limnoglobus roseus]|uniref:DUF1795 domain-containing protein n=1 Tax=Limnoglobus roseus TaxID=2598579 RepID=A0A5C1AM26_9BACT|nr:hypothetical protein [Limnoglobus roseus]QEL20010.1 hypothetical protein PX52LOC_07094 [Limnoglobus roseus]